MGTAAVGGHDDPGGGSAHYRDQRLEHARSGHGEDMKFNVYILGESGVGKTNLMRRYVDNEYSPAEGTMAPYDMKITSQVVDGENVKLVIFDTVGMEKHRSIVSEQIRKVQGVVFAYDTTDRESFQQLRYWMQTVDEKCGKDVSIVLAGTKCDVDVPVAQRVPRRAAQALADERGMALFVTSAKDNTNVTALFSELAKSMLERARSAVGAGANQLSPDTIRLDRSTSIDSYGLDDGAERGPGGYAHGSHMAGTIGSIMASSDSLRTLRGNINDDEMVLLDSSDAASDTNQRVILDVRGAQRPPPRQQYESLSTRLRRRFRSACSL